MKNTMKNTKLLTLILLCSSVSLVYSGEEKSPWRVPADLVAGVVGFGTAGALNRQLIPSNVFTNTIPKQAAVAGVAGLVAGFGVLFVQDRDARAAAIAKLNSCGINGNTVKAAAVGGLTAATALLLGAGPKATVAAGLATTVGTKYVLERRQAGQEAEKTADLR